MSQGVVGDLFQRIPRQSGHSSTQLSRAPTSQNHTSSSSVKVDSHGTVSSKAKPTVFGTPKESANLVMSVEEELNILSRSTVIFFTDGACPSNGLKVKREDPRMS